MRSCICPTFVFKSCFSRFIHLVILLTRHRRHRLILPQSLFLNLPEIQLLVKHLSSITKGYLVICVAVIPDPGSFWQLALACDGFDHLCLPNLLIFMLVIYGCLLRDNTSVVEFLRVFKKVLLELKVCQMGLRLLLFSKKHIFCHEMD